MRRRWLLWLLLIALVWFLVSRFVEIQQFIVTLQQGSWPWVVAAVVLQFGHYVLYAWMFQICYQIVGVESTLTELLPVTFASLFVGVLAITGGAPLFIDDAARRGQSPARAAAGVLLVLVVDFGTFALALFGALAYLASQRALRIYELAGTAALLASLAAMAVPLLLGLWQPAILRRLLDWVEQTVNDIAGWFKRPPLLSGDWAVRYYAEFTEASWDIASHPREGAASVGVSLLLHLVDLLTVYALFVAFHQPARVGDIVAGYAIGVLFWMVSITPQGIGVAEGVMALVLVSVGVPAATATVISLAFRGASFWLPLVVGAIFWPRVRSLGG